MVKYTNAALYSVNLEGTAPGEFDGEHPTLVFQMKMEKEMYIAIPFTTYTIQRWEKTKKFMCCRVKSTNSIARIDKMEIIKVNKIGIRWREKGKLLIPTDEDIKVVIERAESYFRASFLLGINDNLSLNKELLTLQAEFENVVGNEDLSRKSFLVLDFKSNNEVRIIIDKSNAKKISIQELFDLINIYFTSKKYTLVFEERNIIINIKLTDGKALTLKQKHDNLNSSEG